MKNDRAQAILPGYGHFIELKYFEQQIYYSDDSGDDQPAGYFIPQTGNAPRVKLLFVYIKVGFMA
ncbi:hypothetical protein NST07_16190 [Paenibacillus sp. FSL L8-0340]|uniref:hypothetical protein n=1 Tax=Paenibacillus sp. FSL L8-0340 TaxID=2954685 RepID=UPI0031595F1A